MSRNYDQLIDECLGSAFSEETLSLGNGAHVSAHQKAKNDRKQRIKVRQLEADNVNLELPEEIKKCNGWFPVVSDGSFHIVKDTKGVISLNSKIPQITHKQYKDVILLTRNQVVTSGIDKYGCKTTTDIPYSDIIDPMTKDRIIQICCKANRLGL